MRSRLSLLIVALGLPATGVPALAHHSTAMYNMAAQVTVTGTVKRFEWTNPHAYIYLEAKDEKGRAVEWSIELMSLNHLKASGWTPGTLKPGDIIRCTGGQAKSGVHTMLSSSVELPNGRTIKS